MPETTKDTQFPHSTDESVNEMDSSEQYAVDEKLRLDAYSWARVIYPPLKRSGHVILDSCTSEGKIPNIIHLTSFSI